MIEVTVHDVMLRAPKGEEVEWLAGPRTRGKLGFMRVVLLKEQAGDRIVPIWVGPFDGDTLAMSLAGLSTTRPFPFDLMANLLKVSSTKVEPSPVCAMISIMRRFGLRRATECARWMHDRATRSTLRYA